MANRPSAVAFDVVETLMPLEPLAARFERFSGYRRANRAIAGKSSAASHAPVI